MKHFAILAMCRMFVLAFLTGLASELCAEDVIKESHQKILTALKAAREEFLNGVFLQEEKLAFTEVALAQVNQKVAGQSLKAAKALAERRFMTPLQVEAAASAAQDADKRLAIAEDKLKSLRESKAQVLEQFDRLQNIFRDLGWKDNEQAKNFKLLDQAEPGVFFLGPTDEVTSTAPLPLRRSPAIFEEQEGIQAAIAKSKELGAPQPKPLPPGYGEKPNDK